MPSVKDRFLSMLIKSSDYVSGEAASKALGVSRAAVNSAVMSLRNDGYGIDSATNRGYMLTSSPTGSIRKHRSNLSPERMSDP